MRFLGILEFHIQKSKKLLKDGKNLAGVQRLQEVEWEDAYSYSPTNHQTVANKLSWPRLTKSAFK
jgi:hypothetical protein